MVCFSNTKGLTLIEVVVASLLLVAILIPTFTLIHSSLNSIYSAGDRSQLVAAGKGIMEKILSSEDFYIRQHNSLIYPGNSKFRYNVSITYYQGNYNLRSIKVRVYISDKPDKHLYFNTIRSIR